MKARIKEWLRRWAIRQLIKLVDRAEERLQAWQVSLRENLRGTALVSARVSTPVQAGSIPAGRSTRLETFSQWEARRSGVAPVSKKSARRQAARTYGRRGKMTAAEFDLRFAR